MKRLRLFITADGKQAIRTFEEVGTSSEASAKKVQGSAAKNKAAMEETTVATKETAVAVSRLTKMLGVAGLAFGIKDVVESGIQWQEQQDSLVTALKNTRAGGEETAKALENAARRSSMAGGFSEEDQITGITKFVSETKSASEAMKDNAAVTDLARGAHLDYGTAMKMVQMAATGAGRGIQKYIGVVVPSTKNVEALNRAHSVSVYNLQQQARQMGKAGPEWLKQQMLIHGVSSASLAHAKAMDKQATAAQVVARIQRTFGDQTKVYSESTAGQVSNMENSFKDLERNIGISLLPAVRIMVGVFARFAGVIVKHKTAVTVLILALAGLSFAWAVNAAAVKSWALAQTIANGAMAETIIATIGLEGAQYSLAAAFEAMGISAEIAWVLATGGIILLVAAVAAGVYMIVTHWKKVKAAFSATLDWAKTHWKLIAAILAGPVGIAVYMIATHWKQIKHGFSDLIDWIKGHWKLLAAIMLGPITLVQYLIATHMSQIKRSASDVVSFFRKEFGKVKGYLTAPFSAAWHVIEPFFKRVRDGVHDITHPSAWVKRVPVIGGRASSVLSSLGFQHGGLIPRHMATGGHLPGYGGGDRIPIMGEGGEFMLRKEAVQSVGVDRLNSVNTTGSLAGTGESGSDVMEVHVTAPIQLRISNGRILAEEIVQFAAKKNSLSGAYVSG
jgi:hypothetical protein